MPSSEEPDWNKLLPTEPLPALNNTFEVDEVWAVATPGMSSVHVIRILEIDVGLVHARRLEGVAMGTTILFYVRSLVSKHAVRLFRRWGEWGSAMAKVVTDAIEAATRRGCEHPEHARSWFGDEQCCGECGDVVRSIENPYSKSPELASRHHTTLLLEILGGRRGMLARPTPSYYEEEP